MNSSTLFSACSTRYNYRGHLLNGSDKESTDRLEQLFGKGAFAPAPAKEAARDEAVVFPRAEETGMKSRVLHRNRSALVDS